MLRFFVLSIVALLPLAGCGLRGPLYLPDEKQAEAVPASGTESGTVKRRTPAVPAPQAQKKPPESEAPASPAETPQSPASVPVPDDRRESPPDRPADADPVPPPGR